VRFARLSLLLGLVLLLAGSGDAYASKAEWSIFETPALVHMSPAKRNATLDQIKGLGADTLRIEFAWRDIAPGRDQKTKPTFDAADPTAYDGNPLGASPSFGPYDELVRQAVARGFRILATVTGDAPRWATDGGKGTGANANYRVNATEYGKFATAVATRYSGKFPGLPPIFYYSIWNEPNHKQFLKPQTESPAIYRKLVDEGVAAIHANGVKGAKVFVGETAPVGRAGKVIGPKAFLRQWLCLNKRFRAIRTGACSHFKKVDADGYAHHPYGPVDLVAKKADIINLLAIRQLAKYLDVAAGAGRIRGHLPIYNTEFGLQSNPPDTNVSTSPVRQAQLINEKEEYSYLYPRLKSYSQYLLWDDPARKGPSSLRWAGFQTGLRFPSGGPKPALSAYRLPIVVHKRRKGVLIWGRVRPGAGSRYVQLYRGGGTKDGGRIKTNPRGYFSTKRAKAAKYRFKAYDGPSPSAKLFGTSRTASPI
jgi:hypothetical protein